jgi:ATP-dependent protease HslVU (ClpYQ) peptidase subunit
LTTIVGIQGDGWTVMAADSQITDENSKIISPHTPKIIKFNGILIGLRGDARPGDIVAYNWTPPKIVGDPQKWVVSKMIPSMIKAFDKFGYDWKDKESEFNFLVSVKSQLFDIGSDMSISRSQYNMYAAGSGKDLALGYMAGQPWDNIEDAEQVAIEAIATASIFDIHTSEPIQVEIG